MIIFLRRGLLTHTAKRPKFCFFENLTPFDDIFSTHYMTYDIFFPTSRRLWQHDVRNVRPVFMQRDGQQNQRVRVQKGETHDWNVHNQHGVKHSHQKRHLSRCRRYGAWWSRACLGAISNQGDSTAFFSCFNSLFFFCVTPSFCSQQYTTLTHPHSWTPVCTISRPRKCFATGFATGRS